MLKEMASVLKQEIAASDITEGCSGEAYLDISEDGFKAAISDIFGRYLVLTGLFCAQDFEGHKGFTLFYVFEKKGTKSMLVLKRKLGAKTAHSIAETFPSACWYEREINDGFGVVFKGGFDNRNLFLHENYPEKFHPLLKSFGSARTDGEKKITPLQEYWFKGFYGEGVYQIPVGPVHAGIIEPGHFRFSVIGETVFNLEVRMFYKHRGVEKLAEGKAPEDCVCITESISGDESVANAVAFCTAIEKIAKTKVPERALYLRTIFLEVERIYSHLGGLAGMVVDVAFAMGASPFFILREEILRQNEVLTGSRFMKGIIGLGGLKKDVAPQSLTGLSAFLGEFTGRFNDAMDTIRSSASTIDRFEKTGFVKRDLVPHLNLTGPMARATGASVDTRLDHPYGLYEKIRPSQKILYGGDVLSRFEVKAFEVLDCASIIRRLIDEMPQGAVSSKCGITDGYSLSMVESPRGQNMHWVYIKKGVIDRYKVRTPSFCNWRAIEHAALGNIVPDFPLINKSMNLSYAGTDL
ncbi:MAG: hydrogenase [Candidatus Altiarchaeales archaeon IMC4]|nr:MAG: hydrogenase [Candidatus Altiarchaeales archaeon IMC4]